MTAYRSQEDDVWRGRAGAAHTPASDRFITRIVAVLLFVVGFGLVVVLGLSTDFPVPKLLVAIGALPSVLWVAFRHQRHAVAPIEMAARRLAA